MFLETLGAFLAGAGSVLSAFWALRRMRKLEQEACEQRLEAFREGMRAGRHR